MKGQRQTVKPKPEQEVILEVNRETVQDLTEGQAEAARGGVVYCTWQYCGGSLARSCKKP